MLLSGGQSGNTAARLQSAAGARVNYNLYTSASYATVWDNVTGVTQTATGQSAGCRCTAIPVQTTPATGNYTDTVQVTINWINARTLLAADRRPDGLCRYRQPWLYGQRFDHRGCVLGSGVTNVTSFGSMSFGRGVLEQPIKIVSSAGAGSI